MQLQVNQAIDEKRQKDRQIDRRIDGQIDKNKTQGKRGREDARKEKEESGEAETNGVSSLMRKNSTIFNSFSHSRHI